jgi:hypothetical protein
VDFALAANDPTIEHQRGLCPGRQRPYDRAPRPRADSSLPCSGLSPDGLPVGLRRRRSPPRGPG